MPGKHGHALASAIREHTNTHAVNAARIVRAGHYQKDGSLDLVDGGTLDDGDYDLTEGFTLVAGGPPLEGDLIIVVRVSDEYYAIDLVR
jgi:hypothetical protein